MGLAGTLGKLPLSQWHCGVGLHAVQRSSVLETGSRCGGSLSARCPVGSPKWLLLQLEIKIFLNELCVLVSFKTL